MNKLHRIYLLLTTLLLSALTPVSAQLRWIADAPFQGATYPSLYKTIADDKPLILAVGSFNSQSAQLLLSSGVLQDLAANHGTGPDAAPYSQRDLHIAFVDVRVFPDKEDYSKAGLPVIPFNEEDPTLSSPGWNTLYSILGTHLYLVTPDQLVRPLKGQTAADIYAEVQAWSSKIQPDAHPDLRMLDAEMEDQTAQVRVQNFSTGSIQGVDLLVLKGGQQIARVHYAKPIPALEDALIQVPLPQGYNTRLTIVAKAQGDLNPYNNTWSGLLRVQGASNATAANIR
ncbi:MAG: hypothetical protein JST06_11820 [Bacteroidetes bacterium]|nr:hypothetical protein [Bacteroidota bacterium]MBS1630870.1 hypothetical protein [Bacteroidota bacterium]